MSFTTRQQAGEALERILIKRHGVITHAQMTAIQNQVNSAGNDWIMPDPSQGRACVYTVDDVSHCVQGVTDSECVTDLGGTPVDDCLIT
jgi:hypothetical protein